MDAPRGCLDEPPFSDSIDVCREHTRHHAATSTLLTSITTTTRYGANAYGYPAFLYAFGREPDTASFECGQDQLNAKFLQNALIGFVLPKVLEFGTPALKYALNVQLRQQPWTRDRFKLEKKFIRNVYYQVRRLDGILSLVPC